MAQSIRLEAIGDDKSAAAAYMVACATGVSEQEAADWLAAVTVDMATVMITAIVEVSGLEDGVAMATEGVAGPKASHAKRRTSVNS